VGKKTVIFPDLEKKKRQKTYLDQEFFKKIYKDSEKKILTELILRLTPLHCNFWNFTNRKYPIFLKFPKIFRPSFSFNSYFQISCSESEKHNINYVFVIFSKNIEEAFFSFFQAVDILFLRANTRLENFPQLFCSLSVGYFSKNINNMFDFEKETIFDNNVGSKNFPEFIQLILGRFSLIQLLYHESNFTIFQPVYNQIIFFKIFGKENTEIISLPENFLEFLISFNFKKGYGHNFFFRTFYLGEVLRNFNILWTGSSLSEKRLEQTCAPILEKTNPEMETFLEWRLKKKKVIWVNLLLTGNFFKLRKMFSQAFNQLQDENIIFTSVLKNKTIDISNFNFDLVHTRKSVEKKAGLGVGELIFLKFLLDVETIKPIKYSFELQMFCFVFSPFRLALFEFLEKIKKNFNKGILRKADATVFNLVRFHETFFFI